MVQRERVSDNVYSFQSEVYAQVTAGAVIGPNWAVVIDTLAIPEETLEIREFIERDLEVPVRYVINTHYHADHSWGNCFFPGATIIAHSNCRHLLETIGEASLSEVKKHNNSFRHVEIVTPHITFEENNLNLRVGKKTLTMIPLPGHSNDNIGILVEEDRVLFAGDAFMPMPYIVDGDLDDLVTSIKKIGKMGLENVIQGHGDIVLRGEIDAALKEDLSYLSNLRKAVRKASRRKYPLEVLDEIDVESCGKSRVLIGGLAAELHKRNLRALYRKQYGEPLIRPLEDDEYYDEEELEED
ncbi:MAG: MBL fold metallo-hydrolase [Chloroflexi bacterium]|nr:MAG: MBL fold metallo-hydrolase [Chloroflexota bacterium]